jgi:hypothetical protein
MDFKLNLPLVAAILLTGIGLYYFLFENEKTEIWLFLLAGAGLNFVISFAMKGKGKK